MTLRVVHAVGVEERPRRRRSASRQAGPPDPRIAEAALEPAAAISAVPEPPAAMPVSVMSTGAAPSEDKGRAADARTRRRDRADRPPTEQQAPKKMEQQAPEAGRAVRHTDNGRGHRGRGDGDNDRSLRALVSIRSTQVPWDIAVRAREWAAPQEADLRDAEQNLVIVRRNYVPPAPLASGRSGPDPAGKAAARKRQGRKQES